MKFNKILMSALIIGSATQLLADSFDARYEGNYIKMVAQGGLCGGVTIIPKPGTRSIMLESYKYYSPFGHDTADVTDGRIGSYGPLETGGKRFRYDWAGSGSLTHYRIYCKQKAERYDTYEDVNCESVVTLDAKRQNNSCGSADWISGPGVGSEGYKGLNMNQG